MKILKEINKKESGQAFILVLILLLVGGLIIAPLLAFMSTGLIVGQMHEEKMNEVFADDAGVEDTIYNIITAGAPYHDVLQGLDENSSYPYTLTDINGLTVSITVTKLSLIQGLLSEDEINLNAPHQDWVSFNIPPESIVRNYELGWVQYDCDITFYYDETGNRTLESVGAFFSPFPGDENLIDVPNHYIKLGGYDIEIEGGDPIHIIDGGVITFDNLQVGSPETKIVPGGFAFIWRWEHPPQDPQFDKNNRCGAFSFKFKIYDPDWAYSVYFVWSTFREQDISYITSRDYYKWLIEATAGDTTVRSVVVAETGADILTWEINPPE